MGHRHVRVRQRPDRYAHPTGLQGEISVDCDTMLAVPAGLNGAAFGKGNRTRRASRVQFTDDANAAMRATARLRLHGDLHVLPKRG